MKKQPFLSTYVNFERLKSDIYNYNFDETFIYKGHNETDSGLMKWRLAVINKKYFSMFSLTVEIT